MGQLIWDEGMVELHSAHVGDRIIIYMNPGEPVELAGLSDSLAALARMYERHYRTAGDKAPRLYVTKLETGSVLLEVAPFVPVMGVLTFVESSVVVADFANRLFRGIRAFAGDVPDQPRVDPPTDQDAADIREFTKPLLGKRGAELGIKHARYEKETGEKRVMVEYSFDEAELNRAALNIDQALLPAPIEPEGSPEPREQIKREVMLFLEQANRSPGRERGRTGDRGVIPDVSDKALPVYFRKSFQGLKDQMVRDVNPLTTSFVVDVHVQYVDGEPKGYIVTDVHQAIGGGE